MCQHMPAALHYHSIQNGIAHIVLGHLHRNLWVLTPSKKGPLKKESKPYNLTKSPILVRVFPTLAPKPNDLAGSGTFGKLGTHETSLDTCTVITALICSEFLTLRGVIPSCA